MIRRPVKVHDLRARALVVCAGTPQSPGEHDHVIRDAQAAGCVRPLPLVATSARSPLRQRRV